MMLFKTKKKKKIEAPFAFTYSSHPLDNQLQDM